MDNRIEALGIGGWDIPLGFESCSIGLGDRGIVVVGTNGSGKSRLLASIGRSVDLIYRDTIGRKGDFWGMIDPSDDEQPWDFGAGGIAGDESRFHMSDPRLTYLEVSTFLLEMKENERDPDPFLPESVRNKLRQVKQLDSRSISAVAIIFATISVGQGIGDRNLAITSAPHFPFLLAFCMEVVDNGRLGTSRLDDEPGRQWLRIWYNVHQEIAPVATEILSALDSFEGRRVQIDESGLRYIDEDPEIDSALHHLAHEPALLLPRNRFTGPFEFHSKKVPNDAYALLDPVLRENLVAPLPFEGLRLGDSKSLGVGHQRIRRRERGQARDGRLPVESILSERPTYRWDDFVLGHARVTLIIARSLYCLLMEDPPLLDLVDVGGELKWRVKGHGLELLSSAERRWARFSIEIASRFPDLLVEVTTDEVARKWVAEEIEPGETGLSRDLSGFILVVDEPEMGLHRRAEARVTKGLLSLSDFLGAKVVIATHSPVVIRELLSEGADVVTMIRNESGDSRIESLTGANLDALARVAGVEAADMLQLARGFLLVEGEHDVEVLRSTIGSELDRIGVHVFPMRGASEAGQVVDSSVIWRFNAAKVFVLLDSVENAAVVDLWGRANRFADEGALDQAEDLILRLEVFVPGAKSEIKVIRDLMMAAIKSSERRRLVFLGLAERDILNYFDVDEVICSSHAPDWFDIHTNRNWKTLKKQWQKDKAQKTVSVSFKTWLADTFPGTDLSAMNLSRISGGWDRLPPDFQRLLSSVLDVVNGEENESEMEP